MKDSQPIDYTDMLSICPQALEVYQQRGLQDISTAYDIGNILNSNHFYAEAAFLFKLAFNIHSQNPSDYPFRHVLWVMRMVALLKANLPIKDADLDQLRSLSIPFYNYIIGWNHFRQSQDALASIEMMGNCYEEFPTGEEPDRIYLSIIMKVFHLDLILPVKNNMAICNVIPNNLFMYWDESPPSEIVQNFEHQKQLGHFNLKIFNKEEAIEWLYQNYGVEARQLFLSAHNPAEAADFFQAHIINHYGGWWLDASIRIKSFEHFNSIIPSMYEHVFCLNDNYTINSDIFGAVANSPILNECIRTLYHNCYTNPNMLTEHKTGPGIFNRGINRNLYRFFKNEIKAPSLTILDYQKTIEVVEHL